MRKVTVSRHEDGAIEFHMDGGMFYDISKEMQRNGFDYWLGHLAEKSWFTPEVEAQFRDAWERLG